MIRRISRDYRLELPEKKFLDKKDVPDRLRQLMQKVIDEVNPSIAEDISKMLTKNDCQTLLDFDCLTDGLIEAAFEKFGITDEADINAAMYWIDVAYDEEEDITYEKEDYEDMEADRQYDAYVDSLLGC